MWMTVDKDGTERVCAIKPNRDWARRYWVGIDPDDGDYRDCVAMPTGSIERLLGRKLTWGDEPVEITNLK